MQVHSVAEPFTTADVIVALQDLPADQQEVTVVHYGERNEPIVAPCGAADRASTN